MSKNYYTPPWNLRWKLPQLKRNPFGFPSVAFIPDSCLATGKNCSFSCVLRVFLGSTNYSQQCPLRKVAYNCVELQKKTPRNTLSKKQISSLVQNFVFLYTHFWDLGLSFVFGLVIFVKITLRCCMQITYRRNAWWDSCHCGKICLKRFRKNSKKTRKM